MLPKEYMRAWRRAHPEKVKEYIRKYRLKYPEKIKKQCKKWREENPEKAKQYKKNYREKYLERIREYNRKWKEKNKERIRERYYRYGKERVKRWEKQRIAKFKKDKGNKCQICEYDEYPEILIFHHLYKREFTIGGNRRASAEKMERELRKCILVCPNCHALIHKNLIKSVDQ